MKIISHRGNLEGPTSVNKSNSVSSLWEACKLGFGIETDLRNFNGELVISHDLPNSQSSSASALNEIVKTIPEVYFALNIKEDGLGELITQQLNKSVLERSFFFDFSVPDYIANSSRDFNLFSRLSEYESEASMPGNKGVWLDQFHSLWFDHHKISELLDRGLEVSVVSSELHGRDYSNLWNMLKPYEKSERLSICTDFPIKAVNFFES